MSFGRLSDDPRRRAPRHKTDLPSDLGDVVDLSKTGMRVARKGKGRPPIKVGMVRPIKLRTSQGSITVTGRAVWVKRTGFRRYEVGIDFVQLKPTLASALASIAEFGFIGAGAGASSKGPERTTFRADPGSAARQEPSPVTAAIELPDYYQVLGVAPDANDKQIHAAYRALARRYHPDTTQETDGEAKFIELSEAYEVLKDPDQRKVYDQLASRAA